jgi:hypothetical protein
MGTTEKKLLDIISETEQSVKSDETYKRFEQSVESFEELVRKGYASPRGYNLQSFTEQVMGASYSNLYSLSAQSIT